MSYISFTIKTPPRTKKNHGQIYFRNGKPCYTTSEAFKKYEKASRKYFTDILKLQAMSLTPPLNVKAEFYMDSKRKVDLVNLEQALCDLLVNNHMIEDDNSRIIASMDGSRVLVDKDNPRTEVTITELDSRREK